LDALADTAAAEEQRTNEEEVDVDEAQLVCEERQLIASQPVGKRMQPAVASSTAAKVREAAVYNGGMVAT
jgi:hypothetical protein